MVKEARPPQYQKERDDHKGYEPRDFRTQFENFAGSVIHGTIERLVSDIIRVGVLNPVGLVIENHYE